MSELPPITKKLILKNKGFRLLLVYFMEVLSEYETREALKEVKLDKVDFNEILIREISKPEKFAHIKTANAEERNIDLITYIFTHLKGFSQYQQIRKLTHSDVRRISCHLKYEVYGKGDYIFREKDKSNYFFGIIRGKVQIMETKYKDELKDLKNKLHEYGNSDEGKAKLIKENLLYLQEEEENKSKNTYFYKLINFYPFSNNEIITLKSCFFSHFEKPLYNEELYSNDNPFDHNRKMTKFRNINKRNNSCHEFWLSICDLTKNDKNNQEYDNTIKSNKIKDDIERKAKKFNTVKNSKLNNTLTLENNKKYFLGNKEKLNKKYKEDNIAIMKDILKNIYISEIIKYHKKRSLSNIIKKTYINIKEKLLNSSKNENYNDLIKDNIKNIKKKKDIKKIRKKNEKEKYIDLFNENFDKIKINDDTDNKDYMKLTKSLQYYKKIIENGECFGDEDIFKKCDRTYSAYCLENTEVFYLSKEPFDKYVINKVIESENNKADFITNKLKFFCSKKYKNFIPNIKGLVFDKGDIIFTPFDRADYLYIIYQGECSLGETKIRYRSKADFFDIRPKIQIISYLNEGGLAGLEGCYPNNYYKRYLVCQSQSAILYQIDLKELDYVDNKFRTILESFFKKQDKFLSELKEKKESLEIAVKKMREGMFTNRKTKGYKDELMDLFNYYDSKNKQEKNKLLMKSTVNNEKLRNKFRLFTSNKITEDIDQNKKLNKNLLNKLKSNGSQNLLIEDNSIIRNEGNIKNNKLYIKTIDNFYNINKSISFKRRSLFSKTTKEENIPIITEINKIDQNKKDEILGNKSKEKNNKSRDIKLQMLNCSSKKRFKSNNKMFIDANKSIDKSNLKNNNTISDVSKKIPYKNIKLTASINDTNFFNSGSFNLPLIANLKE